MISKRPSQCIGNRGSILIFSVLILGFCLTLILSALTFSRVIDRKISLQNGIDAAILSGITYLSQGLNEITKLNQQLLYYHTALKAAQAGKLLVSQYLLTKKINQIVRKQDFIKSTYPGLALQKIKTVAYKNHASHFITSPFLLTYAIQRTVLPSELPGPYELISPLPQHRHTWHITGYLYRHSYKAVAAATLQGQSLLVADWQGRICE